MIAVCKERAPLCSTGWASCSCRPLFCRNGGVSGYSLYRAPFCRVVSICSPDVAIVSVRPRKLKQDGPTLLSASYVV
jgi:hypothetical protein